MADFVGNDPRDLILLVRRQKSAGIEIHETAGQGERIDGRIVNAQLSNISVPDEEGSRSATAHFEGHEYPVYNSIIDGFTHLWTEQMDWETFKALGKTGFVEGSVEENKE